MTSRFNESDIVTALYEKHLDEGVGEKLKKAINSIKQISASVKEFITKNLDEIVNWAEDNIIEPLKKHMSKLVPGYKWGSNFGNPDGLIESVISIIAKKAGQLDEDIDDRISNRYSKRISEGIQRYVRTVSSSRFTEHRSPIVEAGAIGAVLSVIHWSHVSVDVLEILLKIAPSVPFLAALTTKLLKLTQVLKIHPKLAKVVDWWEHEKYLGIPAKDYINAICIVVGIVEICMGAGLAVLLTTAGSAAYVVIEKIWHHFRPHNKKAKEIKESFFVRNLNFQYS